MVGRFWTIPNVLSLARILLIAPIVYLILNEGAIWKILALVGIAVASDWLDGALARWFNSVSEWGKVLDPLADKLAASAVVLALVMRDQLPLWFLLVVVVRDLLILVGGAVAAHRFKVVLMSIWWGKVAVFMLSLTVLWALLEADRPIFYLSLWITTVLFVYSFILYAIRFMDIMSGGGLEHDQEGGDEAHIYSSDPIEEEPSQSIDNRP